MALIVEDGTGRADAESYVSVAAHKAYCDARGLSYSGLSDTQIEQHARRTFDYMGAAYRNRWAGSRVNTTQKGDWPRYEVPIKDVATGYGTAAYYPFNSVPALVAQAQSELMLRLAEAGTLQADLTRGVLREKVGQIEVEYDPNSPEVARYPFVDDLLFPLMGKGGGAGKFGSIRVVRA